jgi:hypothetical protein
MYLKLEIFIKYNQDGLDQILFIGKILGDILS